MRGEGGIKYKDLNTFILSVNYKFLIRLKVNCSLNSTCLPRFWLMQLFKIPTEYGNDDLNYFHNFFSNELSILDCKMKVPMKASWKGHPFYFEILQSYEKCLEQMPKSLENMLSIPIWYNKFLGTKFNVKLSRAGYNYLKDLYIDGEPLALGQIFNNLTPAMLCSLVNLTAKIPPFINNAISRSTQMYLIESFSTKL